MSDRLRLATRGSPLALAQAATVETLLKRVQPSLIVDVVLVETQGDRQRETPLRELGGQGIFAKEIQQAVLDGRADVAVHSAKDLPSLTADGLEILAIPERLDPADVLVGKTLDGLGPGATVATGSPRRQALMQAMRPDLNVVELRGNMATRLAKPGTDGIDAVITAAAALIRLGQDELIDYHFDPMVFTPQVAQGALALEGRSGDPLNDLVRAIDLVNVHRCVDAERSFLATLGAGCTVPAGAWCVEEGNELVMRAVMVNEKTNIVERQEHRGTDPIVLGQTVARSFSIDGNPS